MYKYPVDRKDLAIIYGKHEVLVAMKPADFMALSYETRFSKDAPSSKNGMTSLEWHVKAIRDGTPLCPPMLWLSDWGHVSGHEGRHRCRAAELLELQYVPVVLRIDGYVPFRNADGYIDYDKIAKLVGKQTGYAAVKAIAEAQLQGLEPLQESLKLKRAYMYGELLSQRTFSPFGKRVLLRMRMAHIELYCKRGV